MAQDNTVSFKAYLLQEGTNEKSEVRRFGVDRDVVSNFDYLKEKLQHVFPTLRNQNFSVVWKDADNDDVVISSNDELMIALSEMQNEVRKLYIKVLGTSAHPPKTEANWAYGATDQTHKGVICDVCDQQIEGIRYHCTECFDYDLCGKCEAKKMHREHIMIRLPTPIPTHVLNPYLGRVMANMDALKGHYGHGHGHGRDRRHHHDRYGRGKWCHLNKTMGEMLASNSDDLMREMFCSADEDKQTCSAEKGKQNVSAEEMRDKMKTKFEKFRKTRGKKAEYLWSVGQKIAEFLDPWGIDVDVEVLTRDENENKNEEGKKEEEKMETEETEKVEVQNKDPKCNAGKVSSEAGPSQAPEACVATTVAQSERANAETDDWTVLNAIPAEQQQQQEYNAADLKDASESTSDSSDDDQTSVIEVQLDELHMLSDLDDVEEIFIAGPCARGRKKHGWKKDDLKKHSHKESDSECGKKHGHKRSGSESRKKHSHKRSGSESRKKQSHKRSISGNRKKYGHRSQQNCGNPPEPTVAATSANQVQKKTKRRTSSIIGAPIQVGAATLPNQAQIGAGVPLTSRTSASVHPRVGTSGVPAFASVFREILPEPRDHMFTGLQTTGMPTSGTNVPAYARPGSAYTNLYPEIPQFYNQAPDHRVQPRGGYCMYTRPHVADAVQKMMAMGFSNEGGWLTQLLEIKNGDIEKALDVLQPVKRS